MALSKMSIRLNTTLADEAKEALGARSRSEAVRMALQWIISTHPSSKHNANRSEKPLFAEQND
jgi:metal-responsive CopG/Arc/MetJ family transcriptional regulator